MNRSENVIDQEDAPTLDFSELTLDSEPFIQPGSDSARSVFGPLHYQPGYAYPLLVWLHGSGLCDERQLVRVMPVISLRNYVAVAPRGFPADGDGTAVLETSWPQTPEHIEVATTRVFEAINEAATKYRANRRRVFLAGFDAGGTMALRIALNQPDRFAGVISLCGSVPRRHNPLRQVTRAREMPILLGLGRDSTRYGPAEASDDLRLLHGSGFLHLTLRQYPTGHKLSDQMLRDLDRWIIEQAMPAVRT